MRQQDKPGLDRLCLPAQDDDAREVARELKHFLRGLGHQGNQHLPEIDADLRQTSYLLDEAVTKLGKHFLGMYAATSAQHALLAALKDDEPISPALRAKLDQLQQEASGCVQGAVTALQFQDMTNQLIGRAVSHVASLEEVLREAGDASAMLASAMGSKEDDDDEIRSPGEHAQTLATLALLNRMLEDKATIVGKVPGKAVAQTHLESGDIDLF